MSPNAFPRRAVVLWCACAVAAVAAPAAHAQPVHQVVAGESLSQIAAVNGLSPAALAAANGVPVDAPIRVGQVVSIPAGAGASAPPVTDVVATSASAGTSASGSGTSSDGSSATGSSASGASGTSTARTSSSAGAVVVQPGDTLSAIAARAGVPVSSLAAHNGVTASALLPAGRRLSLPAAGAATSSSGASGSTASTDPGSSGSGAGASTGATTSSPPASQAQAPGATGVAPSSGVRVSGSQVGSAAAANGVPTALARAIAWQESGNNNGAVSSVGARGVMQVMPDTWTWIDRNLSSRTLDPSSAADNVQAGTLYLEHLLRETGGDQDQAAAAYYQGLSSVRRRGMYDDTKRYVQSVRALRARFGG